MQAKRIENILNKKGYAIIYRNNEVKFLYEDDMFIIKYNKENKHYSISNGDLLKTEAGLTYLELKEYLNNNF